MHEKERADLTLALFVLIMCHFIRKRRYSDYEQTIRRIWRIFNRQKQSRIDQAYLCGIGVTLDPALDELKLVLVKESED